MAELERKDARLFRTRHTHLKVGATAVVFAIAMPAGGAHGASATKHKPAGKAHQKKLAKRLRREVRKNPRAVLRKGFLRDAAAAEFDLPLRLRLSRPEETTPDDRLQITWSSASAPWPLGFAELDPVVPAEIPIDGNSSLEAHFGKDVSGYWSRASNSIVLAETTAGGQLSFDSAPPDPVPVSDFATASDNNDPLCHASDVQIDALHLHTADTTETTLGLFGQSARLALHANADVTSSFRPTGTCGAFGAPVTNTAAPGDPILPLAVNAVFRVSPAVTPDGKVRFGVLTASDTPATPQPSTFARIRMCTGTTASCGVQNFPSRLRVTHLTAEVLVGPLP